MSAEIPAEVQGLAEQRVDAKSAKDYAAADRLRDEIRDLGYLITDTPDGFALTLRPPFDLVASLDALSHGASVAADATCAVIVLVDGWPADVGTCIEAFVRHAPDGAVIVAVDCGNVEGAGLVIHDLAQLFPHRVIEVHLAQTLAQLGWAATVSAAIGWCASDLVAVMDLSTVLDGDALTPILGVFDDATVVGSGWRGVDVDLADGWRSFVDAPAGEVDAVLGYLFVVRRQAALDSPPHPKARFYRNADMEWSLALREAGGRLVIPAGELPVHQERHHGYHDTAPEYRDKESKRTYDRLLARFRGHEGILRPRG